MLHLFGSNKVISHHASQLDLLNTINIEIIIHINNRNRKHTKIK
jgi:hypothetical protein